MTFELTFDKELIVGFFNLPHSKLIDVVSYFNQYMKYYIITKEISSSGKEHLHFVCKLDVIKLESFKSDKYLLKQFPELKRLKDKTKESNRGGEHNYSIKYIKEITQLYYIFKECSEDNQPFYGACHLDWRLAQQNYKFCTLSKKHAMIMWIISNCPNYRNLNFDQFLNLYIEYNEENSVKQETFANFEKHYNIYLRIFKKNKLKEIYKNRYDRLYK